MNRNPRRAGFTLIELMVALALAAMIAVGVMFISSTARDTYLSTVRKVEVYNRFRLAMNTIHKDISSWIRTPDLEFYVDGRGSGARTNNHWDPGEEIPDRTDDLGPGVVDGGTIGEFDEYATLIQRHYKSVEPSQLEKADNTLKVHDAYQLYFRTMTYVDGQIREANVEYMLVDPSRPKEDWVNGVPPPPDEVAPEHVKDLALYKVVRYIAIDHDMITKLNVMPVTRRVIEVATNVTDFRVEYLSGNPYQRKGSRGGELDFRTPEQEFERPVEEQIAPERMTIQTRSGKGLAVGYRKLFGYGSVRLGSGQEQATAYVGSWGDNNLRSRRDHAPVRFGFRSNPKIQFAELVPGDQIYIFKEGQAGGGQRAQGQPVNAASLVRFPPGGASDYTVKTNLRGELELMEDIDISTWGGQDQSPILYKAAYLPSAVRITIRMVDDDGLLPKTMQQVIWLRRKSH